MTKSLSLFSLILLTEFPNIYVFSEGILSSAFDHDVLILLDL